MTDSIEAVATARRRAGFTLIELILVMLILSIVVGGGLGVFASLDTGKREAAGLVRNVLRTAQNTSIASQAPARVRIDPALGEIVPEVLEVVGTWHFERRPGSGNDGAGVMGGGNGMDGGADEGLLYEDGYIGSCLSFTDALGRTASVPVHHDPAFNFRRGFSLECAVRYEGSGGGRLLTIGSTLTLEVGRSLELRGRFTAAKDQEGRYERGSTVTVQSEPGALQPERWARVRLRYDRETFSLEVDGLVVAEIPETAEVWEVDGPLLLSDERRPFPGSLDNLVIRAVVSEDAAKLPETVRFAPECARAVYFDAGGALDRQRHPEPARVVLEYEDGSRSEIAVGLYGQVE